MRPDSAPELRAATPDDADAIREVVRAAYAKWVPVIGREPLPMQADYARAVQEHQIDILSVDGRIVGILEVVPRPDHLWIENIAVAPDWQGRGLGRRLLALAEIKAAASDASDMRLLTNAAFGANVALYQAVGYRVDRTEPYRGGTTVYMSKRLPGQVSSARDQDRGQNGSE